MSDSAKPETDFEICDSGESDAAKYREAYPQACNQKPVRSEFCYLDFETIPDFDREDLFEGILPTIPSVPPETPASEMVPVEEALGMGVSGFKGLVLSSNPESDWLTEASVAESQQDKPRKGIQDAITSARKQKNEVAAVEKARIKMMSTTPEMCKVVAFCCADGVKSRIAVCDPENELKMLELVWDFIDNSEKVVGYGCLFFDLPVLVFRSALLGIDPPRRLDLRKFSTDDVLDLHLKITGSRNMPDGLGKQDSQFRLAGFSDPNDTGFDGSKVLDAIQAGQLQTVKDYVSLDVQKLIKLHRFYRGYYWD